MRRKGIRDETREVECCKVPDVSHDQIPIKLELSPRIIYPKLPKSSKPLKYDQIWIKKMLPLIICVTLSFATRVIVGTDSQPLTDKKNRELIWNSSWADLPRGWTRPERLQPKRGENGTWKNEMQAKEKTQLSWKRSIPILQAWRLTEGGKRMTWKCFNYKTFVLSPKGVINEKANCQKYHTLSVGSNGAESVRNRMTGALEEISFQFFLQSLHVLSDVSPWAT